MPTISWKADTVDGRTVCPGNDVEATDGRAGVVVGEEREQARDLDTGDHLLPVVPAEQVHRSAPARVLETLERSQLHRLGLGNRAAGPVADEDLDGGGKRRDRERDQERSALVPPPPAAQPAPGVDARHEEAGDDVAGEIHVDELVPEVRVREEGAPRVHVDDSPVAKCETGRVVHPRVDRDHHRRADEARDRHGHPGEKVQPRRDAVPAVDVDGDEDRLGEEREALQPEGQAERSTA